MNTKLIYQKPVYWLLIIILSLGIFLRFANLDKKVYWHDEVYTKLHLGGYFFGEWHSALFNGQIHRVEELQKYQILSPEKGLNHTLKTLAVDDPHHPPLYYIIARFWVKYLGNSITVIRSLSAFFSLLALGAMYWLCLELFSSSIIGWVAVSLLAVSPFFILYSQEAREYSFWSVIILASSIALLKSVRLISLTSKYFLTWATYGIILTLGLYTSLFTILVIIAHGTYLLIREKLRLTPIIRSYLITAIASLVLFSPWIIVFIANYEQYKRSTGWATLIKIPPLDLFKSLGLNISRVLVDLGGEFENPLIGVVIPIVLLLVGYSLYYLYRTTSIEVWGFIFTLIIIPIAFLLIPDLIKGGIRSVSPRYLVPSWLGILLSVAYLLTTHLNNNRKIWSALAVTVFSASIISSTVNFQSDTSWIKVISYSLPKVANIINESPSPLVVGNSTNYNPGNLIALSYRLKPEVKMQLLPNEQTYIIPDGFKEIFFLSPSQELGIKIENSQPITVKRVFRDNHLGLWKISRTIPL
ncbi:conserved hypothetical protein [Gloeothece citriformis PCC 7424]|uniref:Glycosyltransferase RgtA/B/C/D-like domain-containing protein n=1 Tax=Gloeothece citriformis (strain PCC 7424) TaxID=65393 RepID=B7K7L5_GLOC7|nr:glycosyltransferase family 39 protein [Gloeothece citriformis]ACK69783.1 conserved hypothetical protein [Gloeothece citriformis PCC 7424]